MISKRILLRIRKEALKRKKNLDPDMYKDTGAQNLANSYVELNEQILLLTQELIDIRLTEE